MNKFLKISVIMLFVIALLITGGILMSKDKKPLHEQIAEYMFALGLVRRGADL